MSRLEACLQLQNEAGALCHGDLQAPGPGLRGAEGIARLATNLSQQGEPAEKWQYVCAAALTGTLR